MIMHGDRLPQSQNWKKVTMSLLTLAGELNEARLRGFIAQVVERQDKPGTISMGLK
jgi:hypothetical protein